MDGFPETLKQAELFEYRSIIPMIVVELELDSVEVLRRGTLDKMKPNKLVRKHTPIATIIIIINTHQKSQVAVF